MSTKNNFPVVVKRGSVEVKVYRTVSAKGYESFQVADNSTGKRKLRTFASFGEAKAEAELIATRTAGGDIDILQLRSEDRASYLRALQLIGPTGVTLEGAAAAFAGAVEILGGDYVLKAARYFAKRNPANFPAKTVNEVVKDFLAVKASAGISERYDQDLRYRLGKLTETFRCPIAKVTGDRLQSWFDSEGFAPQSRVNFRRVLRQFFGFAIRRGYLPKDWDELDRLEMVKVRKTGAVEVFTPDGLRKLLATAAPEILPALVIGAFAGLRTAEIERLDWSEIHLAGTERFIELTASKAKTASRRVVPVSDNLAAWLAPYSERIGKVWRGGKTTICPAWAAAAESAGIAWKANGLRHSAISYRMALVKNAAQVSLECGNSPSVIFGRYRELVREADALRKRGSPFAPRHPLKTSFRWKGARPLEEESATKAGNSFLQGLPAFHSEAT